MTASGPQIAASSPVSVPTGAGPGARSSMPPPAAAGKVSCYSSSTMAKHRDAGGGGGVTRRHSSATPWEPAVGYSRAVAVGDFVFVSGCTSVAGTDVVHAGDAYAQTALAIAHVGAALAALGSGLADVVQTRLYVTDSFRWDEYGRAHAEA